jgi:hypothetical protein
LADIRARAGQVLDAEILGELHVLRNERVIKARRIRHFEYEGGTAAAGKRLAGGRLVIVADQTVQLFHRFDAAAERTAPGAGE